FASEEHNRTDENYPVVRHKLVFLLGRVVSGQEVCASFPLLFKEAKRDGVVVCPCFWRKGGSMLPRRLAFLPAVLTSAILASAVAFSQQAPEYGPAKGTLLVIGGGNLKGSGIYEKFIELAGGPNARYVIVPTAGGNRNPDGSLHTY